MNEAAAHHQQHYVFIFALAVTAIAGFLDFRRGQIPNWLTYAVLVVGPLLHVARHLAAKVPMDFAVTEGGYAVGGIVIAGLVPLLLYRQGAIGGGDVKMCAGLGAMLQVTYGVEAEMYGFLAATIVAPGVLAYRGKLISTLKNSVFIGANWFLPQAKRRSVDETALSWFRLGPALFVGVALTTHSHW